VSWLFDYQGYVFLALHGLPTLESQGKCNVSTVKAILSKAGRPEETFSQVRARFAELWTVLVQVAERGVW